MKKFIITSILAALVAVGTTAIAQDYPEEYLGLPGDNLNLYAVMKLFQGSETLESFERNLNDENSRINNLDLNGDNLIDYITVSDYVDGDVHTIVLRVALDKNDFQDVAVFTVLRFQNGTVNIQLIGDEALYGKNYIIEPIYDETPNPGYTGRQTAQTNITVVRTTPYEIAAWPLIRFIYLPDYTMWRSSWYWGYYPTYWHPWQPFYWDYYYGYHYHWYNDYYAHYHHYDHYRYDRYNDFYYRGIRHQSPTVAVNINRNVYKTTYSHPEQRKEGEALYTRSHPDRPTRTVESRTEGNGNRQPATGNRQESTRPSAGQRTEPSNKPQATGNQRASERQPATGNRQPEASSKQNNTRSSAGQRNETSRKTNPSASGRSEYKPAQSQGNQNARSSKQTPSSSGRSDQSSRASKPSTQSQKSSAGRSNQQSKSSSSRSSEKSKDSNSRKK
jgi:hypothetical protein